MKRNSLTINLEVAHSTVVLPWIEEIGTNRCDGNPDFTGYTDPTLSVLQKAWQDFLDSGEALIVEPDPEPPAPEPDFNGFINAISYGIGDKQYPLVQAWYNALPPVTRDPLQDAIGKQDLQAISDRLQKTMTIFPPDEATLAQIVEILTDFNIPISLP